MKTKMENEKWKDIGGYEGYYQVSDLGRVRGVDRVIKCMHFLSNIKGKVLPLRYQYKGYLESFLSKEGKTKKFKTHRLVAMAFIPNPENLPQVNHKNGIKDDNRVDNLEWCTNQYNQVHAIKYLGKVNNKSYNHPQSKTMLQISLDGRVVNEFGSASEAGRQTGFQTTGITAAARGEYKTCGGFKWQYKQQI